MYITTAVAVGSVATSFMGSGKAKAAAKHQARMQAISNDIEKAQLFTNAAIQNQELEAQFVSDESASMATGAAQGRRGSSGSLQNISKTRKKFLDRNKERVTDNAKLGGGVLDINTGLSNAAAQARIDAGKTSQIGAIITGGTQIAGAGLKAKYGD